MPRTFSAVVLLAALALLPGKALAGPPEGASGKIVFDEVADGLRKYRKGTDSEKRMEWLAKLAPTHDPRVAIALAEVWFSENRDEQQMVGDLLKEFLRGTKYHDRYLPGREIFWIPTWWHDNEAALRRRAAQLPR